MLKCNLRPGDNHFSQLRRNYSHHRRAIRSSLLRNATWALYRNIRNSLHGYELLGRHTEQWDITHLIHDWREDREPCVSSKWSSDSDNQTNNTLTFCMCKKEQTRGKCITEIFIFLHSSVLCLATKLDTLDAFYNPAVLYNQSFCTCQVQAKQIQHLFSSTLKLSARSSDEQLYIMFALVFLLVRSHYFPFRTFVCVREHSHKAQDAEHWSGK